MASNRYDNLIKKFVKEANKRPVTVDGEKVLIPWQLIKAMMQQESAGQPGAESPIRKGKRAIGLLQVQRDTARQVGVDPDKLKEPKEGVRAGVKYFKWLLKQFDGDFDFAISAYNAGPTNVKRGIKKYGRALALKFTHGSNFATHDETHKDKGQSETQAYNRRIRSFYRDLTGEDLPGESYYRAIGALKLKHDKFASGREVGLKALDKMPSSEMIAAFEAGEIGDDDAEYLAQLATTRGNTELAARIREASGFEVSRQRPQVGGDADTVTFRDPTTIEARDKPKASSFMHGGMGTFGSVEAAQNLLAQIQEREAKEMWALVQEGAGGAWEGAKGLYAQATAPAEESVLAAGPAGVALTSPVGLAHAATAATATTAPRTAPAVRAPVPPAPIPAPPVIPIPSMPAAPPPPPIQLPHTWEDVIRTAPAVRDSKATMANKKKRLGPRAQLDADIGNAVANARALRGVKVTDYPEIAGAPDAAAVDKASAGSELYKKFLEEYARVDEPQTAEEEFLQNAAIVQLMGDTTHREVGIGEMIGAGIRGVDNPAIAQKRRNADALKRYRAASGLGKGSSRRETRLRALEGAGAIQGRFHQALNTGVTQKNQMALKKVDERLADKKAVYKSFELESVAQVAKAKSAVALLVSGQTLYGKKYTADASLLGKLLKGDKKAAEAGAKALSRWRLGDPVGDPYVKMLYETAGENKKNIAKLAQATSETAWGMASKSTRAVMDGFRQQMMVRMQTTSDNLNIGAQLYAVNAGNPYKVVEDARGLINLFVKPTSVAKFEAEMAAGNPIALTDKDLISAVTLRGKVGDANYEAAIRHLQSQMSLIGAIDLYNEKMAGDPKKKIPGDPTIAAEGMQRLLGGAEGETMKRIWDSLQGQKGFIRDVKTGAWVKVKKPGEDAVTPESIQQSRLKDRLMRQYGISSQSQIEAQMLLQGKP